jgi:hypothetical protein
MLRAVVAVALAALAAAILLREYAQQPGFRSDFGIVWFAAKSILAGSDPYQLVGPGKPYELSTPLLYPAIAFVPAIPFTLVSEKTASLLFVSLSTFLLAYGMTARSWHLLPMFVTEAFASSARLAQWSLILTAALFIPALGALSLVKPQNGLPVVVGTPSRRTLAAGLIGGIVFTAVSLILLPSWPRSWLGLLGTAHHMGAPVIRLGGVFTLLVLLRWRRWEAWLVLALVCMPQTWGWYNALMLFVIPATWREACVLALVSSVGAISAGYLIGPFDSFYSFQGAVMVATAYLPATFIVLRRPNEGTPPAWITIAARAFGASRFHYRTTPHP